jgi:malonyl CoA-acyl carrier protein transacylase
MKNVSGAALAAALLIVSPALIAQDDGLDFHEDYYLGFSQGVYYGLMLAGTDYDVAWCVKSELAYEAEKMGTGSEFQEKLEKIHNACMHVTER